MPNQNDKNPTPRCPVKDRYPDNKEMKSLLFGKTLARNFSRSRSIRSKFDRSLHQRLLNFDRLPWNGRDLRIINSNKNPPISEPGVAQ
ncbi:hypothetical protein EYC80_000976 [Monilinia laxa]|uniref:Uncharacterized protein n=1 Tax=Monilinia laxa TaxID=61186 RepID=A0A5N6K7V8_MONLA|nr:hypothetical protein EYC80_000976 [Monilinia laxa]